MPDTTHAPDEISAILEAFAQQRAPETPAQRRPTGFAWVTLEESNALIVRAALDEDGDFCLQVLRGNGERGSTIFVPKAALPVLRALLGQDDATLTLDLDGEGA